MKGKRKNFTVTLNEVADMYGLSWEAKGIWTYMVGKPKDWKFSAIKMSQHTGEGEKATKTALRELTKLGLLKRVTTKEGNKFTGINYILASEEEQIAVSLKQAGLKWASPKQANINNTQINQIHFTKKEYRVFFLEKARVSDFWGTLNTDEDEECCVAWLTELSERWHERNIPLSDYNLDRLFDALIENGWDYHAERMGESQLFPLEVIQTVKSSR
jgi:hypothetical protein